MTSNGLPPDLEQEFQKLVEKYRALEAANAPHGWTVLQFPPLSPQESALLEQAAQTNGCSRQVFFMAWIEFVALYDVDLPPLPSNP